MENYEYWGTSELIAELEKRDLYQKRVIKAISGANNLQDLYHEVLDIFDGAI